MLPCLVTLHFWIIFFRYILKSSGERLHPIHPKKRLQIILRQFSEFLLGLWAESCSEDVILSTLFHNPEGYDQYHHHRENLKSRI
jgi:hypothetical protein